MSGRQLEERIAAIREFNRFYTRQLGILNEHLYHSPHSLTEVRILYELANRDQLTATDLCRDLGLNAGYVSRIVSRFARKGLIRKVALKSDARQSGLSLTPKGRQAFAPLNKRSHDEVAAMLEKLGAPEQAHLSNAMRQIQDLVGQRPQPQPRVPYILRPPRNGDMGWIVYRHGTLYSQEYGYDEHFEALVAEIVAKYVNHYDPQKEHCWIAERESEVVGSVFLVKHSKNTAKLRLLYVEPQARGLGIGKRLVEECVRFGRQAGYQKIILWTQSELRSARHVYEQAGFLLVEEKPHHSWTRDLVAETWELKL
jgi:DNA-binding MarR family transcriptional regulator/GNAT superfamily N-acetyltransferase